MSICHESMEWLLFNFVIFIFNTVHAKTSNYRGSTGQTTTPSLGVCLVKRRIYQNDLHVNVMLEICCNNFYRSNGVCVECPTGFYSRGEQTHCKKCGNSFYGKKCRFVCRCNSTERCDNEKGCLPIDERTEKDVSTFKGLHNDVQETKDNNVVIYMTCVAVGSVLVVVCGLIVKNREALCRCKPSTKAMTTEIKKRKRSNLKFSFGKVNVKKESLYADINEKYMLNFDGE